MRMLCNEPFVKEVYMDENFVSITKYDISTWEEVVQQVRTFIGLFTNNIDSPLVERKKLYEERKEPLRILIKDFFQKRSQMH